MRLVANLSGILAAGVPICAPGSSGNRRRDEDRLPRRPLWFVQSADDLVTADIHTLANYRDSKRSSIQTCISPTSTSHIEDETGRYHDKFGQPQRYIGHFASSCLSTR